LWTRRRGFVLLDRNERYHQDAVRFHRSLDPSATRVITWAIISETYTWLRYHSGYQQAERWLQQEAALEGQGVLDVVYPAMEMEVGVRRNLSRYSDQDLSYADALSLYVVQSRGDIDAVFAFDHHLALVGAPVFPGPLRP